MRGPRNGPRTPPVAAARLVPVSLAFGVAYGGAMPLYPVVTREFFGERAMGTAYGAVFFISCIGMGLGSYREVPFTTSWAPISGCSWARSRSGRWRLSWG